MNKLLLLLTLFIVLISCADNKASDTNPLDEDTSGEFTPKQDLTNADRLDTLSAITLNMTIGFGLEELSLSVNADTATAIIF